MWRAAPTLFGVAASLPGYSAALSLSDLRVEYLTAPVGVDVASPRFSWLVNDPARGAQQISYHIVVATAGSTVWDSGEVTSSQNYLVPYAGAPLTSDTNYSWTVSVKGGASASAASTFRTGLTNRTDWAAEWVTGGDSDKLLRTEFALTDDVSDAFAYVSGIGYHALYCNGARVGDHQLDVGWTDYSKRVYYVSHDLTACLQKGKNALGVMLGNGWYAKAGGQPGAHSAPPAVLLQANIRYRGGAKTTVVSSTAGAPASGGAPCGVVAENQALDLGCGGNGTICKVVFASFGTPAGDCGKGFTHDASCDSAKSRSIVEAACLGKAACTVTASDGTFGDPCVNTKKNLAARVECGGPPAPAPPVYSWKAHAGPITYDSLYNGEHYDARLELPGWAAPGFDDSSWSPVTRAGDVASVPLSSQLFEPIRKVREMSVVNITRPKDGMYVVEFGRKTGGGGVAGQNFAGWVRLKVKGGAGTVVTIRHAEVKMHPPYGDVDGTLYYGNLRGAQATDTYTLKGDPAGEVYEPTFTQHGFRFCEVTGFPGTLTEADITAFEVHTDLRNTGSASFSSELYNQIQSNTVWGQASNVMSVPTDCDQRDERRGWTGDAALTAEEATYNYGTGAFYTAWMNIVRDDQGADGHTTNFVPSIGSSGAGAPNWQSAYPTVIWTMYRYLGDVGIVRDHWDSLKKYFDYFNGEYKKNGVANFDSGFGDWVPAGPKANGHLVGAFAYLHDLGLIEELAGAVGDAATAAAAAKQRDTVGAAFHTQWFDAAKGCYGTCIQTENAMALWLGVVPAEHVDAVINNTARDIMDTHHMHTTSGIIGIKVLFEAMSRLGRADIPVLMTQQTTYPSYGYMINSQYEPATTMWELWNSDTQGPGMNSRNHIMFGTVSSWFYRHLCGLDVPKGSRGYDKVTVRPVGVGVPGADVHTAACTVLTPRGEARSSWTGPKVPGARHGNLTCSVAAEGETIPLACPGGVISGVTVASYGTPTGDCITGVAPDPSCNADITALVKQQCVGKESCNVQCDQHECDNQDLPDPCYGTVKRAAVAVTCSAPPPSPGPPPPAETRVTLEVIIPVGSSADVRVPLVPSVGHTTGGVVITEGGKEVWARGKYVAGVDGVSAGAADGDDGVVFAVTSGSYAFAADVAPAP